MKFVLSQYKAKLDWSTKNTKLKFFFRKFSKGFIIFIEFNTLEINLVLNIFNCILFKSFSY